MKTLVTMLFLNIPCILTMGCSDRTPPTFLGCYFSDNAPGLFLNTDKIMFFQKGIEPTPYTYHVGGFSESLELEQPIVLVRDLAKHYRFRRVESDGQIFVFDFKDKRSFTMVSQQNGVVTWRKGICH